MGIGTVQRERQHVVVPAVLFVGNEPFETKIRAFGSSQTVI